MDGVVNDTIVDKAKKLFLKTIHRLILFTKKPMGTVYWW